MSKMTWSRDNVRKFGELRRALPIIGAILLLVALTLPMWRITLTAPQYPEALTIDLYAYPRLEGDVREVQRLNSFVGFYYPDPVFLEPNFEPHENAVQVPEWSFGPLAFVAVAATSVFVAIAPTARKLRAGLTAQLVGTIAIFAGMFALIQYRLYQAGHSLDPAAPMNIDGFTPPVLGSYEIANISGFATFGPGGYLALLSVLLLVCAFLLRNSTARIGDLPEVARVGISRVRERVLTPIGRDSLGTGDRR